MNINALRDKASTFRLDGAAPDSSVVVFFLGVLQGWSVGPDGHLPNAADWRPGSIALDLAGEVWIACGGSDLDGADHWRHIDIARSPSGHMTPSVVKRYATGCGA